MKISKQILERMIHDEMRQLREGTPAEHRAIMSDPTRFARNRMASDPRLREFFFFPIMMVGKSKGSMFLKNLLMVHFRPDLLQKIKENLLQAIKDQGISGVDLSEIHFVRTKDQQYWMRIGYENPWPTTVAGGGATMTGPFYDMLTNLDWAEKDSADQYIYVVGMKDLGTKKLQQPTVKRTKSVKIPGRKGKKSFGGKAYEKTFGQLGGLKGVLGLPKGASE